jgi:superfamily II DNA or RNA helicase
MDHLFSRPPWQHQREGVTQTIDALTNGTDSVCLTAPTGAGKTACEIALAKQWAEGYGLRVLCLTNRILLTQQTREVFQTDKVHAGVISASMPQFEREDCRVQIATIQTILSRRSKEPNYWVEADLVLADEVHQMATGKNAELLNEYVERGAKVVGVTATPLGVSNVCDELIVAARTRDLQKDGILCEAHWFAPFELDTRNLTTYRADLSLSDNEARKTWGPAKGAGRKVIVGKLIDHYRELHPDQTLHVDGKDFWVDGKLYTRDDNEQEFQEAMQEWREGDIDILWNRFVLREGIDEPQIECILLATPVGSYRSFFQMVGRGLRVHPDKSQVKVIDFGGNWWRHGSVNVNVDWESYYYFDDEEMISKNRVTHYRETGEHMGQGCPKCGMVHKSFKPVIVCQYCGHEFPRGKASRPILQKDGKLVHVSGEPIKRWRIRNVPGCQKHWEGLYWNAFRKLKNEGIRTSFSQVYQQYYHNTLKKDWRTSHHAPRNLPLMPKTRYGWYSFVGELRQDELYQGDE